MAQVANGRHAPQRALGLKPFRDDVGRIHVRINGEVRLLLETAADRRRFMALAHASQAGGGGHRQSAATLARLSSCVWWPSMRDDVSEFVAACLVCQQLRPPAPAQLHGDTPVVGRRFDTVHIDLASVDATAECEHKAFLVVVDSVSAMPAVLPMVDQTAERVIEAFERGWLARFGTPRVIVADNGPQLDCELMRSFARRHGIALRFVAPYHQQANGLAERTIQSIKRALRALVALDTKRTGDWTQYVHEAVWSFVTATSSSRGVSPFELVYGQPPILSVNRLAAPVLSKSAPDVTSQAVDQPKTVAELRTQVNNSVAVGIATANEKRLARRAKDKERIERPRGKSRSVAYKPAVGDVVWLENNGRTFGSKFRNAIRRSGPFVVTAVDTQRLRAALSRWESRLPLAKGRMKFAWHRLALVRAPEQLGVRPAGHAETVPEPLVMAVPFDGGTIIDVRMTEDGRVMLIDDGTDIREELWARLRHRLTRAQRDEILSAKRRWLSKVRELEREAKETVAMRA